MKWNGKTSNQLAVEVEAPLKKPDQFKVIGRSFPRRDLPLKVFGRMQMVSDLRLPGMLHARMVGRLSLARCRSRSMTASVEDIPGAKVVRIKDLLAVVADKEWNAVKAAARLKVRWSNSKPDFPGHDGLHAHIRKAPVVKREVQRENGSVEDGLPAGRARHRGRVRISDPIPCQHRPGLRRGRYRR